MSAGQAPSRLGRLIGALAPAAIAVCGAIPAWAAEPVRVAVMDPLSRRLSCACVQGHAQRRYEVLKAALERTLGREVVLGYGERMAAAERELGGAADLLVGPRAAVAHDAAEAGRSLREIAALTDGVGSTTVTGVFVVRAADRARSLRDLRGRRVLFGPVWKDEKHAAALSALSAAGAAATQPVPTRPNCTLAAADVAGGSGDAAVVSAYAVALLDRCGAVRAGSLRVVGRTAPVPFVRVFVRAGLPDPDVRACRAALASIGRTAASLRALESRDGFIDAPVEDWADWRGPRRDGTSPSAPQRLPAALRIRWIRAMSGPAMSGVAATESVLVVADKVAAGAADCWRCLSADTGEQIWGVTFPAAGKLESTNSPRATPVIVGNRVYVLGAFGRLACLRLDDGGIVWQRDLVRDLGGKRPDWGYCSTPLVQGSRVIVNPGGPGASVVALDRLSGEVLWRVPGAGAAYASFAAADVGGVRVACGFDANSLGTWRIDTGERMWTWRPPRTGDFNVPSPVVLSDGAGILVATENNGARIFRPAAGGALEEASGAACRELAPDTSSVVVEGGRAYGVRESLVCADVARGMAHRWTQEEPAYGRTCSLIAGGGRLLILSLDGTLSLVDTTGPGYRLAGRLRLPAGGARKVAAGVREQQGDAAYWSHPALVGGRLYVRSSRAAMCVELRP